MDSFADILFGYGTEYSMKIAEFNLQMQQNSD